jgi:NitT/TauT family transport system permease protein/taurine transport system permease protein
MNALLPIFSALVRLSVRFPVLMTLAPFVPVVAIWWLVATYGPFPDTFFPGPPEVAAKFVDLMWKGILPEYLADSLTRLAVGAAVGILIGVPVGLLIGLSERAHKALWPVLLFFQAIGDIAWLPILIIWFGFGLTTMTFVIVYTVVFPVILNTVLGVRSVKIDLIRAAQSLGAPPWRIVAEVIVPGALPNIITGIRNGLGFGWRALIAAEMIVGTSGIGFLMFDARRAGSVVEIVLGMIVLGILWYIVDSWLLAPAEKATGKRWGLVTS